MASAIPASSEGELRLGSRHRVPNRSFPGMPASLTCHSTLCRTHAQHCTLQSLSWTLRPTCSWRVNLHLPLAIMIGQLTGNRPGALRWPCGAYWLSGAVCVQKGKVGKSSSANLRPVRLLPGRTEQSSCLRSSPLASAGWRQVRKWPMLLHLCSPDACVTALAKNTVVLFRHHIEVCTHVGALMQMKAGTGMEFRGVRLHKMHQAAQRQGAARQTCWQTRHPRSCSLMMTG